jgi:hypothetical protein
LWGVDGRVECNNDNRRDLLEMIRLEFVDLLSVIQSSAPSCSSPWRRKPSIHWHSKSLLAVDPASTTCGTVNPLSFGHQKRNFSINFLFWFDSYPSSQCPELRPMATGRQSHRFRVITKSLTKTFWFT